MRKIGGEKDMILTKLEEEYREIINEHVKKHKNFKKYRKLTLIMLIALIFIPIIATIIVSIINWELLKNLSWLLLILVFSFLYIEHQLKNKLLLQHKDKVFIYQKLKSWLDKEIHIDSISYLLEIIEREINTRLKDFITNLVIAGALFLAIWQSFVTLVLQREPVTYGLLILGGMAILGVLLIRGINSISNTIFRITNDKYYTLEKIAYYIREYRLEIAKERADKTI